MAADTNNLNSHVTEIPAASGSSRAATPQTPPIEADALELLLRSPRLTVDTILRLLDISEATFRNIIRANPDLGALLRQRSQGQLEIASSEPLQCKMCEEWFLPYAGDRYCSDECKTKARIERRRFREESCGCLNQRAHRGLS
ncbi:MAG: hypothetical protein AAF515_10945 [Pseudomonadota bacterium]